MQLNSADMASLAYSICAVDASFLSGGDRFLVRQSLLGPEICHVRHTAVRCLAEAVAWSSDLLPIFLVVNQEFNFI